MEKKKIETEKQRKEKDNNAFLEGWSNGRGGGEEVDGNIEGKREEMSE